MISSLSLQDLAELPHRIERLEAQLLELRERLGAVEPPAAPLTVRQCYERFGWSENQVRWLLFNRDKNGPAEAVSARGRLVIDAIRFSASLQRAKRDRIRRYATPFKAALNPRAQRTGSTSHLFTHQPGRVNDHLRLC
jgi:hypothetical protein